MALSNMLNEPRRELTESAMGIIFIVLLYFIPGIYFSLWLGPIIADDSCKEICSTIFTFILIWSFGLLAASVIGWGLLLFTHFIGEKICDALENNNIYLRPRRRY